MLIWLDHHQKDCAAEHGLLRADDCESVLDIGRSRARLAERERAVLEEARLRAEVLMCEAEAKAQERIEQARAQAVADLAEARRRGYEEGTRQAALEWHARQTGTTIEQARELAGLRDRLAGIVTSAVERIVQAEPRDALFQRALRNVQSLTRGASSLTLRVHADDLSSAESAVAAMNGGTLEGLHVDVVADPALARGGCIFETEGGILDASLDVQLAGLREAMDRAVRRAGLEGAGDAAKGAA
jgi:type III secretion protein L